MSIHAPHRQRLQERPLRRWPTLQRFADSSGLCLEVTSGGSRLWRWKYRYAGKEKRLAIGQYPSVSLAEARRERDKARSVLQGGADPSEVRRDAKRAAMTRQETAFEPIARRWWSQWRTNKTARYTKYVLDRMEADAFPEIGHKPVADLTAPAFVRMAKKIEARGASELARRVLAYCGQVMRWSVAHAWPTEIRSQTCRRAAKRRANAARHIQLCSCQHQGATIATAQGDGL